MFEFSRANSLYICHNPSATLDKVVFVVKKEKGTPVTAEIVGIHMFKPLRAWFSCSPAVVGATGGGKGGAGEGGGREGKGGMGRDDP